MNIDQDISTLAGFERNTAEFLARLKQSGQPLVLTINGKAELVVQDIRAYQRLVAIAERFEAIQAVKEGLASINGGDGRTSDEVFDALEQELRSTAQP